MFCIVCHKYPTVADKVSRLYVGMNGSSATGFCRDSLVSHEKSHSHQFCFQRANNEEKPEQVPLQRISRKIGEIWYRIDCTISVFCNDNEFNKFLMIFCYSLLLIIFWTSELTFGLPRSECYLSSGQVE